jgi:hypothetical protein
MERGETTAETRFTDTGATGSSGGFAGKPTYSGAPTTSTTTSTTTRTAAPQRERELTGTTGAEALRRRNVLPLAPEKLERLKAELPRAIEKHWANVQGAVPHTATEAWDKLPYLWQYTLFADAFIVWPLLGALMLMNPSKALSIHSALATFFGWAGPSPMLASNTLLMYVQATGALCLALGFVAGFTWYRRDGTLARAYSLMRMLLAGCLFYAVYFGHPLGIVAKGKTSTVYYALLPFAVHSLWHAGAILTSGPEFWRKLLGRVPAHLH